MVDKIEKIARVIYWIVALVAFIVWGILWLYDWIKTSIELKITHERTEAWDRGYKAGRNSRDCLTKEDREGE